MCQNFQAFDKSNSKATYDNIQHYFYTFNFKQVSTLTKRCLIFILLQHFSKKIMACKSTNITYNRKYNKHQCLIQHQCNDSHMYIMI